MDPLTGAQKNTTYFAKTNFRGAERVFGIRTKDRRQHMYVIGKTGTGKSVLLKNMAIQDIHNGHGLAVVDPHGEFVEEVMASIPEDRAEDVIYVNPADQDYAIGFNVLEVPDPQYKHLIASGLMGIFTKIWANLWSSRMEYILNNAILALLDTPGTTLLSVPRILVDEEYRKKIVDNVTDPVVKSFWVNEYASWNDRFRSEAISAIQNKVGQFLATPLIRNIVGQEKSTINFDQIMDEGKILLVNVSKGRIGEDNSALLGAMIITKLQLAAMERVKIPEEQRRDFFLYVDEFQNFATKSFASILSEARKYRLNLVIAHQYTAQLITDMDTSVRDAVFGNCGTMVVFRVGAADAEMLETEFAPEFTSQDLVNLPNYHIYTRLMCNGMTSRPFSAGTLPPIQVRLSDEIVERIVTISRDKYARRRSEVEGEINERSHAAADGYSSSNRGGSSPSRSSSSKNDSGGGFQPSGQKRYPGHLDQLNIEFGGGNNSGNKGGRRTAPSGGSKKQSVIKNGRSLSEKRSKKPSSGGASLSDALSGGGGKKSSKKKRSEGEKKKPDLEGLRATLAQTLEKNKQNNDNQSKDS